MKIEDILAQERRARMAAERLLAQKQAELSDANRILSLHALSLSDEITETREVVEEIKGENTQVRADLERANKEVVIAKRRLWDSLETIEDGFAVFDQTDRMIAANSAYLKPFDGLTCVAPGVRYVDILNIATEEGIVDIGDLRPLAWRDMMLARWHAPKRDPLNLRLWDGTHIRLIDRRSRDGDMVCLGLNITETITYQTKLKEARHRAEAANRAKSAFLANMSHEIRTPMNGVVSMAELMAESELDDEQRLYVDTIRKSGEALLTIINDVLDYSKIEAAKLALHPEPFDLEKTILDVVTLLQPTVQEKGIQLSIDFDLFMPTKFMGDAVRLRQILTNLIGNAVKFTSEGHVLVRAIGLPADDDKDYRVHLSVEDSGIGIPKDMQAHIFGEFNQVEDERNRRYEGTGLGLAIVKRLVKLMDSEIWLESEEGEGSCFGFNISLPALEHVVEPNLPDTPGKAVLALTDGLNKAILEKRLRALGFEVTLTSATANLMDICHGARLVFVDEALCPTTPLDSHPLRNLNATFPDCDLILLTPPQKREPDCGCTALTAFTLHTPVLRTELFDTLNRLGHAPAPTTWPPAASAPIAEPLPVSDTQAKVAARQMRVLAAEDNKTNQLVFSKLVKSLNIDLRFANNGLEAVEAFLDFKPDLIFMDISMPEVDGKEATRRIRLIEQDQNMPRTRIVALTAHAMPGDAEEIMAYGLDNYLTKPLRKPVIFDEIMESCPEGATPPMDDV
ncbi:ATP-binding protein [uncultured Aliiroseovarius sp.]|uniref:ATP-binding protein n=1 Tax=uncultured Aliiroseovarius sp. TaxID=1658783 RepID=UPI00262B4526|nr:ATP-binding protein [uncultured Aliiroseovarius sp.]